MHRINKLESVYKLIEIGNETLSDTKNMSVADVSDHNLNQKQKKQKKNDDDDEI